MRRGRSLSVVAAFHVGLAASCSQSGEAPRGIPATFFFRLPESGKPASGTAVDFVFRGGLICDRTYVCVLSGPSDARLRARLDFRRQTDGVCRTDGAYVDEVAGRLRTEQGQALAIRASDAPNGRDWFCSPEGPLPR